ncbi:MAG TPA: RNA methyltransferase [Acidimicrobiia bacterium]
MTGRGAPRGARNPAVVAAARLHRSRHRRDTGRTLIEGPNLLEEALNTGVVPERLFASADDQETVRLAREAGVEVIIVDQAAMGRLAGTETPRGPVAVIAPREPVLDRSRDLLVAHGVGEPGNLGSLIRTAAAFGWGFAWTPGSADPWSPKSLRAGAGGQFRVPVARIAGVSDLDGWTTVATVVSGGDDPASLGKGNWAVLVGEEASGLPEEVVAVADRRVTVPMPGGTESLNVGVAAGIVVYQLTRNRSGSL